MDALKWFKANPKADFAPNAFDSKKDAIKSIKKLYALGAKVEINLEDEDYEDEMIIIMPSGLSKKLDVVSYIFSDCFPMPDEISPATSSNIGKVDWKKDKLVRLWWD
jgi:hypothetical protein